MTTEKWREDFRKLWGSINKENQHLTTERIEDFIDSLLSKEYNNGHTDGYNLKTELSKLELQQNTNKVLEEVKEEAGKKKYEAIILENLKVKQP